MSSSALFGKGDLDRVLALLQNQKDDASFSIDIGNQRTETSPLFIAAEVISKNDYYFFLDLFRIFFLF